MSQASRIPSMGSVLNSMNAQYVDQLYEAFLYDPESVPADWRNYFYGFEHGGRQGGSPAADFKQTPEPQSPRQTVEAAAERLINAYRRLGHLYASINPLNDVVQAKAEELQPRYYGISEKDLATELTHVSIDASRSLPLAKILQVLDQVYCGSVGSEYQHIDAVEEIRWIEQRLEASAGDWQQQLSDEERREILADLTAAEGLEQYLHRRYIGQKRFSLEGGDSLIPMLDAIVQGGGKQGMTDIVVGMAHRGRLNVLVNLMGKAPQELFSEFEGHYEPGSDSNTGDVKYHQGFYSNIQTAGGPVHVSLAFNPSHLEIVCPVVEGGVRARQDRYGAEGPEQVLPVLIHGDAAFIGQGVITETFNLAKTHGYKTGGTVHIVINNQIGFTTSEPLEARSTHYCTEVAKLIQAPIFHVNGDDPDAVVFITRLALDYRNRFHNDVVIDLVCYRRQGHNEADEPMVTQPAMYQRIREMPTTRALYAQRLQRQAVIEEIAVQQMVQQYRESLESGHVIVREFLEGSRSGYQATNWSRHIQADPKKSPATTIDAELLQQLGQQALQLPEGFALHSRVERVMQQRQSMLQGEMPLDWGMAETLAYASLLHEGVNIRLTGQDTGRGTFAHRHAMLFDQNSNERLIPLQSLAQQGANFDLINSVLSELAALAFEYGYATSSPDTLVIWEAQFGDFANGAQIVIDQFISSGFLKWGRLCQLSLFLPHGFEGQGPEHSSARLERFLQLCAELNMRVWNPTTPAQLFHLIRDQYHRDFRRPLVVMMPKSLLRHPLSTSALSEFSERGLSMILPEVELSDAASVRRVVLCSGKVYFDLLRYRQQQQISDVAIVRIEQLYPFPRRSLSECLKHYSQATELVWCQEEPRNQGAWYQIQHHLRVSKLAQMKLGYAGRQPSAAPACGNARLHAQQQQELVQRALSTEAVDDPGERLEDTDIH